MSGEQHPDFESWLGARRPVSQSVFGRAAFADLLGRLEQLSNAAPELSTSIRKPDLAPPSPASAPREPMVNPPVHDSEPIVSNSKPPEASTGRKTSPTVPLNGQATAADGLFPLGRRLVAGKPTSSLSVPLELLEKHLVVLAGAGSGKTVLLKRIVEEAALRNVPSIVIDGANDLAALGDRWPIQPTDWTPADAQLAERYHREVDKIVWTPGNLSGNPLRLELLPDLTSTLDDPSELESAISMVSGSLADILKLGPNAKDQNKRGILRKSLRFFVEQGGIGLLKYIELLADLPPQATLGIDREAVLARELSDRLRVLEEIDPMISEAGEVLDPALLFGDDAPRPNTRVSIINLGALGPLETQQRFVGQLATTLFAWIKKYPKPPGRSLRGLLIIDEAKDLVPARQSTPCKDSLMRLTAQARKYHLGVVFATQNPREIDNTIIGNCSTQFYGKASSPAAIQTIREQLAARGGSGEGIGRMEKGVFYVFNADAGMRAPEKISVPLCLSHHHPLDGDEVLERAIQSRRRLAEQAEPLVTTPR